MIKRPRLGRPAVQPGLALVPRIFAVVAAVLLVGSIALASLVPSEMNLRQAIDSLDGMATEHAQHALVGVFGHGFWEAVMVPLLVRPVWMIPVCLGLICVGGAVTALSQASPHRKQRRS